MQTMCRLLVLVVATLAPPFVKSQLYTIPDCVLRVFSPYDCTTADETNGVMYVTEYPPNTGCYFSIALRTYRCTPNALTNGYYFDRICLIMRCDGSPDTCYALDLTDMVRRIAEEILGRDPLLLKRVSDTVRVTYPMCWRSGIVEGCYEGRACVEADACCCHKFEMLSYGSWSGPLDVPMPSPLECTSRDCPNQISDPPCQQRICPQQ